MDDSVCPILKSRLARDDREELLDDSRRLAEVVRENLGPEHKREADCLNAAMQAGVPMRLLGMPAATLTKVMVANYAKQLSGNTGLKDEVARWAIEAWAFGLGLKILDSGTPSPSPFKWRPAIIGLLALAVIVAIGVWFVVPRTIPVTVAPRATDKPFTVACVSLSRDVCYSRSGCIWWDNVCQPRNLVCILRSSESACKSGPSCVWSGTACTSSAP
jgi:hypothetical protein